MSTINVKFKIKAKIVIALLVWDQMQHADVLNGQVD